MELHEKSNQNSAHIFKKQVAKSDSFKMPWLFRRLIEWGEALSGQGLFVMAFQTREKHKRPVARIAFFVDRREYLALKKWSIFRNELIRHLLSVFSFQR